VGDSVIRNVTISDIMISGGGIGFHLMSSLTKTEERGVFISDVSIRNVRALGLAFPLIIHGISSQASARIENVVIDGYSAECFAHAVIAGNTGYRPRNVELRNVEWTVVENPVRLENGKSYPDTLLRISSADDLRLRDVRVRWNCPKSAWWQTFVQEDVSGIVITDCCLPPPSFNAH